jgi:hypothetical protein
MRTDYTQQMTDIEAVIKSWDLALWEYTLVFEGLSDDDLWKRPAPGLLSIGELTVHVGFSEAVSVRGAAPASDEEYSTYPYKSLFMHAAARYYPVNLPEPITLPYSVAELEAELKRVHEDAVVYVSSLDIDLTKTMPGRNDWDWFEQLRYRSFHLAYHAGQAYSVRHLLGHETTDN